MVSFPITKVGTWGGGSLCKSSDYETNFDNLIAAANQLFERFGTTRILAWSMQEKAGTTWNIGQASLSADTDHYVLSLLQVPSWMQGLRLRELVVTNASDPLKTGTLTLNTAPEFGVFVTNALSDVQRPAGSWAPDNTPMSVILTEPQTRGYSYSGTPQVIKVSADYLAKPGDYVGIYGLASVDGGDSNASWNFDVAVYATAMVPVP